MAKKVSTAKKVTKKRVKKNVERGQAHIQSSFNKLCIRDRVDKVRGMDIIFVTTAKTDEEARELLTLFNMPFAK